MAFVSCENLGDQLIVWLNLATPEERAQLCTALDCGEDVDPSSILGLLRTCSGVAHAPGNQLPTCQEMASAINQAIADKWAELFGGGTAGQVWTRTGPNSYGWADVPSSPSGLTSVAIQDSQSVDLSGNGTSGTPLSAAVRVSGASGQQLSSTPAGLYVGPPDLSGLEFTGANTYSSLDAEGSTSQLRAVDGSHSITLITPVAGGQFYVRIGNRVVLSPSKVA